MRKVIKCKQIIRVNLTYINIVGRKIKRLTSSNSFFIDVFRNSQTNDKCQDAGICLILTQAYYMQLFSYAEHL